MILSKLALVIDSFFNAVDWALLTLKNTIEIER